MEFYCSELRLNFRNRFAGDSEIAVVMARPADIVKLWKDSVSKTDVTNYSDVLSGRPNHVAKREFYKKMIGKGKTVDMPKLSRTCDDGISIDDGRHRLVVFEQAARKAPNMLIPIIISEENKDWLVAKLQTLRKEKPPEQDLLSQLLQRGAEIAEWGSRFYAQKSTAVSGKGS